MKYNNGDVSKNTDCLDADIEVALLEMLKHSVEDNANTAKHMNDHDGAAFYDGLLREVEIDSAAVREEHS